MDRRQQPRFQPEGLMKVRIFAPGRLQEGYLVDLNNAGAFVATDLVLEKGTRVHLELTVPGEEHPCPVQAVVAHCSREIRSPKRVIPAGLGLAFVGQSQADRQLIQQIVMTALAVDLLGYKKPGPADTLAYGREVYRSDEESNSP